MVLHYFLMGSSRFCTGLAVNMLLRVTGCCKNNKSRWRCGCPAGKSAGYCGVCPKHFCSSWNVCCTEQLEKSQSYVPTPQAIKQLQFYGKKITVLLDCDVMFNCDVIRFPPSWTNPLSRSWRPSWEFSVTLNAQNDIRETSTHGSNVPVQERQTSRIVESWFRFQWPTYFLWQMTLFVMLAIQRNTGCAAVAKEKIFLRETGKWIAQE